MNAPVSTPKVFDRKNEIAFRGYIEAELGDTYRKSQNILVPFGFSLGFMGATGQEVNFGLDASSVFSITVDGTTIISFSTTGDLAALEASLTAAYEAADAVISASVTTEATARSSADSAEASTRASADATLQTNINTVSASVTAETSARVSADSALASSISELDAAYQAADATISASVTSEASARAAADSALAITVTTLTATVNAKNQTFIQTSAPTAIAAGDLWIDSDDNNRLYRATAAGSGSWVAVPYTDTGKVTTFAQTTAPTALAVGDLWIDTDDSNKVYRATATGSGSWVAVDDARISVNASAIATIDGLLAASYTIELDVNGRATLFRLYDDGSTSGIIFQSTAFQFYDGITDRALISAGGGVLTINGDVAVTGSILLGAARWPISAQPKLIYAADGDAVEWAGGVALNEIPDTTIAVPAGVALASGEAWEAPSIQSATTTGGTLRLKISTPGSTAGVTDSTDAAGGGGNPDRVMAKGDSADAYNNVYQFRVAGSLHVISHYSADAGGYVNEGMIEISPWFDDGGGFDEGTWFSINPWDAGIDGVTGSSMTGDYAYDVTVPVTWANAIGAGGTYAYGVSKESGHASSTLTDLTSVYYLKQTASGTRTGSPNGELATIAVTPKNQ